MVKKINKKLNEIIEYNNIHSIYNNQMDINKNNNIVDDEKLPISLSLEFFPSKTSIGEDKLLNKVKEMIQFVSPTFVTLTWRSAFKDEKLWLHIGSTIQMQNNNIPVLLHLTCHLPKDDIVRILKNAKEAGIRNILALRGDPPLGNGKWSPVPNGFQNAIELIRFIKKLYGNYFCIGCAGYPEVHIECWDPIYLENPDNNQFDPKIKELDINRLKEKQDAGANFIITQFFYDVKNVIKWIHTCREKGIHIPIIPGYLPLSNYKTFIKFTQWCKTRIPSEMKKKLEIIKNNEHEVKEYGIELAVNTWKELMNNGIKMLHFYTMNQSEVVIKILEKLDLMPENRFIPKDESNIVIKKSFGNPEMDNELHNNISIEY